MGESLTLQNRGPGKKELQTEHSKFTCYEKVQQDEQLAVPSCGFLPQILLIKPYPLKQWPSTGDDFVHRGHLAM